jgi:hypothetical protein
MNTFLVIGAPGSGKTPFVKQMIEGKKCLIFDIQNEYGNRVKYPGQTPCNITNNTTADRSRYTGDDINQFINLCFKKENTICVFEEATAFFQGKTAKLTNRLLINRYHTRNVYLFLFHSINRVPPGIMEMSNYAVLFKTNDELDTVERKYSRLLKYFIDLQGKPPGEKHIIKLL